MIKIESYKKTKESSTKTSGGFANVTYVNNASSSSGGGTLTEHSLWGQPFDGTQDVNGTITTTGNVYSNNTVSGETGIFPNLSSQTVTTTNIMATDGHITNLTSTTADIDNINSEMVTTVGLSATTIEGDTAEISKAEISNITSDTIVVNSLEVLKAAHFTSLTIDEIKAVGGRVIVTVADAELIEVEEFSDYWRCYFLATDDTDSRYQTFAKDDLVVCQTFNAATGTSYDVSNTYYWRGISNVSTEPVQMGDNMCHYVDISKNEFDVQSISTPSKGDKIVQLGNKSDTSRQSAIIISAYNNTYLDPQISAPSIVQYDGIDDYELASHRKNVISKNINEFHGSFKVSTGEDIETLISGATSGQTTYRIEPYLEEYYRTVGLYEEKFYGQYRVVNFKYKVIKKANGVETDITNDCHLVIRNLKISSVTITVDGSDGYLAYTLEEAESEFVEHKYCIVDFYDSASNLISKRFCNCGEDKEMCETFTSELRGGITIRDSNTLVFDLSGTVYKHVGTYINTSEPLTSGNTELVLDRYPRSMYVGGTGGFELTWNGSYWELSKTITVSKTSSISIDEPWYLNLRYKGKCYVVLDTYLPLIEQSATLAITDKIQGIVTGSDKKIDELSSTTTNFITTTEQTLSSITSTVEGHTTTINNLSGDVVTVKNDMSEIKQTQSSITSTVSAHTNQINSLSGDIVTVKDEMSEIKQTQSSITSTVTSMENYFIADNLLRGYATGEGWTAYKEFDKTTHKFSFYDNTWCYTPPCIGTYATYTLSFSCDSDSQFTNIKMFGSFKKFDIDKTYVDYNDSARTIMSVSTSAVTQTSSITDVSWNTLAYDTTNKRYHVSFKRTISQSYQTLFLAFNGYGASDIVLESGTTHHNISLSNAYNQSQILQKSDEIKLSVTNVENGLKQTGIDITNGLITINADNTVINGNLNLYAQNDVDALTLYDSNGIGRTTLTSNEVGYLSSQTLDNSSDGHSIINTAQGYSTKICINDNLVVQSGTTVSGGTQWQNRIAYMYMFYYDTSGNPQIRTNLDDCKADLIFEPKSDTSLTTYTMSGTNSNDGTYVYLLKNTNSKITFTKAGTYKVYIGLKNHNSSYVDDVSDTYSVSKIQKLGFSYAYTVSTDNSKAIYATDGVYISHKENDYLFYGKDGLACSYHSQSGSSSSYQNVNGVSSVGTRNAYMDVSTGYPTDWHLYWGGYTGPSHIGTFKNGSSTSPFWTNSQVYGNVQQLTPWTSSTTSSDYIYGSTDVVLVDYLMGSSTSYMEIVDLTYAEYEGHVVEIKNMGTNSKTTLKSGSNAVFFLMNSSSYDNLSSTYKANWWSIRLVFRNLSYSSSKSSYSGQWIVLSMQT